MLSQIKELKYHNEIEVTNLRTESFEVEQILKNSFQEECEAFRQEASAVLESTQKELKYEQIRRQQLQSHLTESETQLWDKIQKLEEMNILLQNKADQADLESTRLKMNSLHEKVSYGL